MRWRQLEGGAKRRREQKQGQRKSCSKEEAGRKEKEWWANQKDKPSGKKTKGADAPKAAEK